MKIGDKTERFSFNRLRDALDHRRLMRWFNCIGPYRNAPDGLNGNSRRSPKHCQRLGHLWLTIRRHRYLEMCDRCGLVQLRAKSGLSYEQAEELFRKTPAPGQCRRR